MYFSNNIFIALWANWCRLIKDMNSFMDWSSARTRPLHLALISNVRPRPTAHAMSERSDDEKNGETINWIGARFENGNGIWSRAQQANKESFWPPNFFLHQCSMVFCVPSSIQVYTSLEYPAVTSPIEHTCAYRAYRFNLGSAWPSDMLTVVISTNLIYKALQVLMRNKEARFGRAACCLKYTSEWG